VGQPEGCAERLGRQKVGGDMKNEKRKKEPNVPDQPRIVARDLCQMKYL